jgi:hypothetical protein
VFRYAVYVRVRDVHDVYPVDPSPQVA